MKSLNNPVEFTHWYRQQYHAADKTVSDSDMQMSGTKDQAFIQLVVEMQIDAAVRYYQHVFDEFQKAIGPLTTAFQKLGETMMQTFTNAFKPFEDMFGEFGDFWQQQAEYENKAQLFRTRQRSHFRDIKNLNRPDDSQRSCRTTYWWGGWRRK